MADTPMVLVPRELLDRIRPFVADDSEATVDLADELDRALSASPVGEGLENPAFYRAGEFIGNRPVLCEHGHISPDTLCPYCEGERPYPGRLAPAPSTTSTAEQDQGSFSPEGAKIPTEREVRLVLAAREVAFGEPTPEAVAALDRASEAYAADVPWDNEPEDER